MGTSARGVALVDVLAAMGLSVVIAAVAVPVIGGTLEREHTLIGAHYLSAQVQRARLESLKRAVAVAVRLEELDGRASVQLFADGNGNGVRQKDINRRIDPALTMAG